MSPKKVAKVGIKAVMKHRHTDLKEAQKWANVAICMVGFTNKIANGRVEAAAMHFGIHKDIVRGVVREYRNEVDAGAVFRIEALGKADGWNIRFVVQPAQSPDMNKNDLAFFYSLQCRANDLKGDSKSTTVWATRAM
jgi:hypothetical protein